MYAFPLFAFIRRVPVLSKVMASDDLTMILVAPQWPQCVCVQDLSLLVKQSLQLPVLESGSTTHSEVHQRLEIIKLHVWKLSSGMSARQVIH